MKIKVAQGVQVVHDGKGHDAGETADVPEAVARNWIREGWATPASDDEQAGTSKPVTGKTRGARR